MSARITGGTKVTFGDGDGDWAANNLHRGATVTIVSNLARRAARNYPDSDHLQQEWLRAVRVVRGTKRGWVLDRKVARDAR